MGLGSVVHRISMAIRDTLPAQPGAQRPEPASRKPQSSEDGPDFASFMTSPDQTQTAAAAPRATSSATKADKTGAAKASTKTDDSDDAAGPATKKPEADQ